MRITATMCWPHRVAMMRLKTRGIAIAMASATSRKKTMQQSTYCGSPSSAAAREGAAAQGEKGMAAAAVTTGASAAGLWKEVGDESKEKCENKLNATINQGGWK